MKVFLFALVVSELFLGSILFRLCTFSFFLVFFVSNYTNLNNFQFIQLVFVRCRQRQKVGANWRSCKFIAFEQKMFFDAQLQ